MLLWSFATFRSATGRTEVQDEIDRYDDYAREAFSRAVAHLAVTEQSQWNEPHAKKLKGGGKLYEIRYKAYRSATRAIGYFVPDAKCFGITILCTHKQNVYKPPEALDTAATRAQQVADGTASFVALTILGEEFPSDDGEAQC